MNEIDNYKYLFFKKIYDELKLNQIEKELPKKKIMPLKVVQDENYDIISNYFFLLNDLNLDGLSNEQLQEFHNYFSKKIKDLTEIELHNINEFIEKTYSLLLFPKGDEKYVYYGAINTDYTAPRDAIAIGIYYDVFVEADDFEIENNLAEIINYIQFELAKKINKKIAVIAYNQITLETRYNNIDQDLEK